MGENIIITKIDGSRVPVESRRTATRITSGTQTRAINADDKVELTVESPFPQEYAIGDTITVFGRKYKLNVLPTVAKTGMHEFQYRLTFEGVQYDLLRVHYDLTIDTTNNELQDVSGDALTGNLGRFLTVLVANANRVFPGEWAVGTYPETQSDKTLTFGETDNCLAVLQSLCSESNFDKEFDIVTENGVNIINIVDKVGSILPYTFRYGRGGGMYNLNRDNVSDANIVTRLKVYGSTSNITSKYRANRLCLPGKSKGESFIEKADAVAKYGVFEGRKNFDDIKPTFTGKIQSVFADNVLKFVDASFPFDLNAKDAQGNTLYLISGTEAKVHFNTGNLAGYDFSITAYDHATHTFTLKQFADERGNKFPSSDSAAFQFGVGDEYKVTDITYSEDIINAAEQELEKQANEYYDKNSQPRVAYSLDVTKAWLAKQVDADESSFANVFAPGDYLHIVDDDLGVDKSIRVKSFTRNVNDVYDYKLTISDLAVTATIATRVIAQMNEVDKIVEINRLKDPVRARANWQSSREVMDMVFDPDGDYYTDKIKPNSIDTLALSVGAKSMQFGLTNTVFQPNYNGVKNTVKWAGGVLTHYTIDADSVRSWVLADGEMSASNDTDAFYIYAKCDRTGATGTIVFSTSQHGVNSDANYYYFWIGILNSVDTELQARSISLSYGFTMVNGRFIKTGRIESADGETYFDLDNSEIGGRIVFTSNGQSKTLEELGAEALESKNYINNTLPGIISDIQAQIDGQIEQFFYNYDPTLTNEPASGWTTDAEKTSHLGDLFYNTDTGKVFRFIKNGSAFAWSELSDSEVAQALAIANDALELAKTKRRIFVNTPTIPYEIGDLWVQGGNGDIMRCKSARPTGNYTSSDWERASNYTDDSALNTFIEGTYSIAISDLTSQIDGKIESWFQTHDPATAWTTQDVKMRHVGDMWFNTADNTLWHYTSSYTWSRITDATAIDAYNAASEAQDTANGKRRVFVTTPTTPYDVGDLWVDGKILRRCQIARTESSAFLSSDWVEAVAYDNTKTVIDGGLVTSGTIQVAGDSNNILAGITGSGTSEDSIRFWAGATFANRVSAPFRVTQDGRLYATDAVISGEINATSGEFRNVDVYGSFRSPFVEITDSFDEQFSDNLYSKSLSSHLYATLPWTANCSGRRVTIIGSVNITAPSGKYFYENGLTKTSLSTSYECVELLGFGSTTGFAGWIVLSRTNFRTNYGHGRPLHPLAVGRVTGSDRGASISAWTFDGNKLSVTRMGVGSYKVVVPSNWFYSGEYCYALATGIGYSYGSSSAPIKVTVKSKSSNAIIFLTSDDETTNDGSFEFMLYNISTWDD